MILLQRATHVTLQVLETHLSGLGLKASEMNVLANLADGRPRTVSELAAAAGVRPTTLTGVLDRLEQKGHLVRETRDGDRRAVQVSLTPAGVTSSRQVQRAFAALEERALEAVPPVAVEQARRVLTALAES
ncbi:MarR family transcriptional regulator [Aeromicrobium sp. Root236]|nr:MarR family transcriptional regulator [Aeromicrobium sp. Root236]